MTGSAVCAKLPFVGFILAVTGETILWCRLQISDCVCILMAAIARYLCMFARQWKDKLIVIEVVSVAIYTIVAGETSRAEG